MPETAALTYDYIMIDMDKAESIENFEIYEANRNYFVTSIIAGTSKRFPFVVTAKILGVITPSQNQIKALYIV